MLQNPPGGDHTSESHSDFEKSEKPEEDKGNAAMPDSHGESGHSGMPNEPQAGAILGESPGTDDQDKTPNAVPASKENPTTGKPEKSTDVSRRERETENRSNQNEKCVQTDTGQSKEKDKDADSGAEADEKEPTKRTYTGANPGMKCLKRQALCMPSENWAEASEKLSRRYHVVELRCPKLQTPAEPRLEDIKHTDFDGIRINVWTIFKALLVCSKIPMQTYQEGHVPYIFWMPFNFLLELLPDMEDHLAELQSSRLKRKEGGEVLGPLPVHTAEGSDPKLKPESCQITPEYKAQHVDCTHEFEPDEVRNIKDIEFFIKFIRTVFSEQLERQERLRNHDTALKEVSFAELPYLLGPSSNESIRAVGSVGQGAGVQGQYDILRCNGGHIASRDYEPFEGKKNLHKQLQDSTPRCNLDVVLAYWFFTGSSFINLRKTIAIPQFLGTMLIRQLQVYPIAYLDEKAREQLQQRNARFLSFAKSQLQKKVVHRYYDGLSVALDSEKSVPTHVDSEIILDHDLATQFYPQWRVFDNFLDVMYADAYESGPSIEGAYPSDHYDGGIAYSWAKERKTAIQGAILEKSRALSARDPLDLLSTGELKGMSVYPVAYGFILRNRKWACLDIQLIQKLDRQTGNFASLVIPDEHKALLIAMVRKQKRLPEGVINSTMSGNGPHQDLVQGKGKGLIILLHGPPGVGKTSTAECVASYTSRPLFPITCGNVGYEPEDVETNLEYCFRLAHRWGCVLLLDEADVFLAKRSKDDNLRETALSQEAFKSRIHISLFYSAFDPMTSRKVWHMNLDRLRSQCRNMEIDLHVEEEEIMRWAGEKFRDLGWNGRQIRNAFQTAFALAEYEHEEDSQRRRRPGQIPEEETQPGDNGTISELWLRAGHFEKVAQTAKRFDVYMERLYGGRTDSQRAHEEQLRAYHDPPPPHTSTRTSRTDLFDSAGLGSAPFVSEYPRTSHNQHRSAASTPHYGQNLASAHEPYGNSPRFEYGDHHIPRPPMNHTASAPPGAVGDRYGMHDYLGYRNPRQDPGMFQTTRDMPPTPYSRPTPDLQPGFAGSHVLQSLDSHSSSEYPGKSPPSAVGFEAAQHPVPKSHAPATSSVTGLMKSKPHDDSYDDEY